MVAVDVSASRRTQFWIGGSVVTPLTPESAHGVPSRQACRAAKEFWLPDCRSPIALIWRCRPLLSEPSHHLAARPVTQFAQDVLDMHLDGPFADDQPLRNFPIAQPSD